MHFTEEEIFQRFWPKCIGDTQSFQRLQFTIAQFKLSMIRKIQYQKSFQAQVQLILDNTSMNFNECVTKAVHVTQSLGMQAKCFRKLCVHLSTLDTSTVLYFPQKSCLPEIRPKNCKAKWNLQICYNIIDCFSCNNNMKNMTDTCKCLLKYVSW